MLDLRRRELIALLGGAAAAWPLAARAQRAERTRRIGFGLDDDTEARARFAAFRQGLAALGWSEGRNVEIVARFGTADSERNRAAVAEIIALAPDVVVTSNPASVASLMKAARTISIVFTMQSDPVAAGFAESMARPGGNATGFAHFEQATVTKWLELLRQIATGVIRVAFVLDPKDLFGAQYLRALDAPASALGIQLTSVSLGDSAEFEQAVAAFARERNGGLIVPPSAATGARHAAIIGLAAKHHLPAIYAFRYHAVLGGLISYGPDVFDLYRRPASYVDRIFKGATPAELPIQLPTKYELVINLKTAKALGLDVPLQLQQLADEVIE
jgi:putative tryptophan/tyrosine transport system substrate-binding protein